MMKEKHEQISLFKNPPKMIRFRLYDKKGKFRFFIEIEKSQISDTDQIRRLLQTKIKQLRDRYRLDKTAFGIIKYAVYDKITLKL